MRLNLIVVDSDVLIEVLRGNSAVASGLATCVASGIPVPLTPISVAEIVAGARRSEEAGTLVFLGAFDCLRIDRSVGEVAGKFLLRFGASHGVELADALVGACAAVHGYRLWTLNRKHYPMKELRFFSPPASR